MRTVPALLLVVRCLGAAAPAMAESLDETPIAWGETDERETTVCAKRWHALKIRDIRTGAVWTGKGAEEQVKLETQAVLEGAADCVTVRVRYTPVEHADVILGAETWVQVPSPEGPVPCRGGQRCRWVVQTQVFVESAVEIDGQKNPGTVYVATPRQVQPARLGGPAPMTPPAGASAAGAPR